MAAAGELADADNDRGPMSNVEFVTELMEFSPYGAASQVFVLNAIASMAKTVSEANPAEVDNRFMPGTVWVATAQDILKRIRAQYGPDFM